MSESGMRTRLVKALKPLHGISVENPAGPGTPDVNYVGGWLELKWLRSWPKRAETPVRLDHELMPHQRAWLRRRRKCGGLAWVMLQCGREWLLFDGAVASEILGTATRQELYDAAYWRSDNGLNPDDFVEVLIDAA